MIKLHTARMNEYNFETHPSHRKQELCRRPAQVSEPSVHDQDGKQANTQTRDWAGKREARVKEGMDRSREAGRNGLREIALD